MIAMYIEGDRPVHRIFNPEQPGCYKRRHTVLVWISVTYVVFKLVIGELGSGLRGSEWTNFLLRQSRIVERLPEPPHPHQAVVLLTYHHSQI